MLSRTFCVFSRIKSFSVQNCIQKAGYKSLYSLDNLYPNSKFDFSSSPPPTKLEGSGKEDKFSGLIPVDELNISYTKSSGPGGQHVNKVNTKVEIRFHVQSAKWIPEWIKPHLIEKERGRITKDGYLVITSDKTRKQVLNQADCLEKIRTLVYQSSVRPHEPTKEELEQLRIREEREKAKILRIKKSDSLKKLNRQSPSSADF